MADLIDRDALLKDMGLTDAVKYGNKDSEQQTRSYSTWMSYEIADAIWDAPAVNRWIPCSERMPKNEKPCAVVTETGGIGVSRMMGRNHYEWALFGQRVTHWMPLPEPPESEAQHEST